MILNSVLRLMKLCYAEGINVLNMQDSTKPNDKNEIRAQTTLTNQVIIQTTSINKHHTSMSPKS